jgi:hypothetical protein
VRKPARPTLTADGHVPDDLDHDVAGRLDRLFTAAEPSTTVRLSP